MIKTKITISALRPLLPVDYPMAGMYDTPIIFHHNLLSNMSQQRALLYGALAVVIAALLWSLDGTFLRPKLYSLPSVLVVFIEHLLGFIALLPFIIIYRAQMKLINKKQWAAVVWVALFGGALGTTFITKSLFLTGFHDISVVILLQKFQPIFAIILAAIFLRERFPKSFYLYAALAVIGGYFVAFKNPFAITSLPSGPVMVAIFALLAAFSWGSSTTFGKYSIKNISYGLLAALRFGLTIIIMAFPALYFYHNRISTVTGTQWGTFLIIVFSSGAVAMFLYYYGLKKIPASVATLCELSWPVSAIFFDYFLNHNILSATQLAGTTLLLLAVYKATSLNRSYAFSGTVVEGISLGGEVGINTANLDPRLAGRMPHGLFTCQVMLGECPYQGLLYYGHNSLQNKLCLEVHILDFNQDIKGKEIAITTQRYIRLPKKFSNAAELAKQLKKDLNLVSV